MFEAFREKQDARIRPEIRELIKRGNVTVEEMRSLRANSYEWEALTPALSTEALIERAEHAIENCPIGSKPAKSYPEAVHNVFAPELIKRLRAVHGIETLKSE